MCPWVQFPSLSLVSGVFKQLPWDKAFLVKDHEEIKYTDSKSYTLLPLHLRCRAQSVESRAYSSTSKRLLCLLSGG